MIFRRRRKSSRHDATEVVRSILADRTGHVSLDDWLPHGQVLNSWTITREWNGISLQLNFGPDLHRVTPTADEDP